MREANNVKILCIETGQIFESAKKASEEMGLNHGNISSVVNGSTIRRAVGGFHFKKVV
jgi:hypothetical protein